MNILALDVASKTGYATARGSGVWDMSRKRDHSEGMRIRAFERNIGEIIIKEKIDVVVFERSAGHHKNALIIQAELHGVLKSFCERNHIDYRAYSAGEIKKFATGKGNSGKPEMVKAAEKYGVKILDDNHADALHLYHLAIKDLS